MTTELIWAAGGTGFTALLTLLGSSVVFFFRRPASTLLHRTLLGFAAGVMIAASMWSLLIPAIDQASASPLPSWLPAAGGSSLGILFLLSMDLLIPRLQTGLSSQNDTSQTHHRTFLFILAVTLHNIPEGMAVGISCANAASQNQPAQITAAMALAFGIGIQNFPEGAAIALPLYQGGMSRTRAFIIGSLSGFVEPLFGVLTAFVVGSVQPLMPWLLSFAAGAMLYVVAYSTKLHLYVTKNQRLHIAGFFICFLLFEHDFHFLIRKNNLLNKDFCNALAFLQIHIRPFLND